MNPKLMRIFATLFLALPLLVSCATQAESNAADGKGDELERAIGQKSQLQGVGKHQNMRSAGNGDALLSQSSQDLYSSFAALHTFDSTQPLAQYTQSHNSSCGVDCLECQQNNCIRYNWIGLCCIGLLLVNLLALAYCLWLTKKIRKQADNRNSSASILTEQGSISRSIA